MSETRFSADDLKPSPEERLAAARSLVDRIAAAVAVIAAGVWVGGPIVIDRCVAPILGPISSSALAAAVARFSPLALGAAVIVLAAELARTWAAGARGVRVLSRVRRAIAILLAAGAAVAVFGHGDEAAGASDVDRAARLAAMAAMIREAEVALGAVLIALHVLTLDVRRPDDDDDYLAPLPPGPA